MEQASVALKAAEDHSSQLVQTLNAITESCDADIQQAVNKVVSQYKKQISQALSCTHEHQVAIKELWEQVHTLELSLANCVDLPSVGQTQESVDLHKDVFNILPGTVNAKRDVAIYNLPDQPFSFQKHVQFGDRPTWPDLKSDSTDSGDSNISIAPQFPPPSST